MEWAAGPFESVTLPDGTMIAIGQESGLVSIWRIGDTRPLQTIKAHKGNIKDVVFHPGGKLFATSGVDGRLMVWKVGERDPVQVIRLPPVEPYFTGNGCAPVIRCSP